MTIDKFYTILYFLEYFKVKYDNILQILDFLDPLSERSEFIVCENSDSENKYTVYRVNDIESLSTIEKLIKNLKDTYQQYTSEKIIIFNKNIPGKNKDFYLKIFNKIHLKIKLKFLSALILSVSFYNVSFYYISIILKELYLQKFPIHDAIFEKEIKAIIIIDSEITSNFLNQILTINGLETLEIRSSKIYFENFTALETNLLKKFISHLEIIMIFVIFSTPKNHISNPESSSDSLKVLFEKYDLISIKKLCLCYFTISELNVETFGNLFNLMDFTVYRNIFQNIYFSELFCTSHEYNIKKLLLVEINIVEKDLRFTANLKKLKSVELRACKIDQTPYSFLKFMFENEYLIELKYYYLNDNLSKETIKFIKEKFKPRRIVVKKV
ncbi:hypothetical protein CWI36_0022p0010 [Hamiltosporidium magnivora]|uniref:Uncharacterized protein n=1 Tax=Hamiltosporidium magnivora TaxID=148818 RepID=A0A4Q9LQ75_9MICR|nr:hypothetical protein CWI36_0022p0010 [Hamiltosporidium magnivora]